MFDQTIFDPSRLVSRYAPVKTYQASVEPWAVVLVYCVSRATHGKQAAWHCCWEAGTPAEEPTGVVGSRRQLYWAKASRHRPYTQVTAGLLQAGQSQPSFALIHTAGRSREKGGKSILKTDNASQPGWTLRFAPLACMKKRSAVCTGLVSASGVGPTRPHVHALVGQPTQMSRPLAL